MRLSLSQSKKTNILMITVPSGKEPRLHNGTQQILDLAVSIGKLHD
jgi:hypothetical protein